ncbi:DUF2235 domain-containing protein [Enterovibrio sp. ZSDZ42]|uniref:DUF2235 domain-containing protein n=1 Tax=Enterovibrio gelatinilyticus TaxID=2899819 RepID=A0ABT5QZQ3_9GAMM|nr:DUF2235 domain-containing protein [Enterovibrio sp. ZSDZ42]MDD1792777.1 DUF2235 domain-containing protein [Enterovibrio sp. ZSDZ42]
MGYRVIKLSELASYEFGKIEGAFSGLAERELEGVLPQGMALNKFKAQLEEGQLVLLSDAPITPALQLSSASSGDKTWQLNTATESSFTPQAKSAFVSRTKAKGSASRSGTSSDAQAVIEPPYTPQPPVEDKPEKPGINYEYLFEVACSENALASEVGCQFALGKTPKEASIVSWETKPSEYGTVFSAKATDGAPRKLITKIANSEKGVTRQEPVKLRPKGTDAVREAFIPVVPSVQLGTRLGFPTEGYYYHFHERKLVQEYKILGENRWAFYATRSTHEKLNTEQAINKYQGAILLYWKIDSKVVKDQHLVYLDAPITREQLDSLSDEWLNEHGTSIDVPELLATMQTKQAAEKPYKPQTANAPADVVYDHKERLLMGSTLKAINNERLVESGLPVVKVKTLPNNKLTIGVFFDGTGNNLENDRYKETRGKTSRTNIGRLFDAYPEKEGEIAKIYISGVGTLDFEDREDAIAAIDNDEDMETTGMATGSWDFFGNSDAFDKWTSLIGQLRDTIADLEESGKYDDINHIEFDVFGFSRGAALARHFVNAANVGFPHYDSPVIPPDSDAGTRRRIQRNRFSVNIVPHLLSSEHQRAGETCHYHIDESKQVSVRFVGIFDTVGSFGIPGDNNEDGFNLILSPSSAEMVYHITAHHEYRGNFPLTSLKIDGKLADNFYEEVFPGAHADVGGGYPSMLQYGKKDLPDYLGFPIDDTYNRELVKKVDNLVRPRDRSDYEALYERSWDKEVQQNYGIPKQYGRVRSRGGTFYFYRLQPISNGLQGITQERMRQQAELAGINWDILDYELPVDYDGNTEMKALTNKLLKVEPGCVDVCDWQQEVEANILNWVHRPHDPLINPGWYDVKTDASNFINVDEQGNYFREIFDNE